MDKQDVLNFLQFEYAKEMSSAKEEELNQNYEHAALHLIRADNFLNARKFIMDYLFKDDEVTPDGAKLTNEEADLLFRLAGVLSVDFLKSKGFTDVEASKIIKWHYGL